MPKKENNRRLYTGKQPKHKAKFRIQEAQERQEAYNNLSIEERIALLDRRLGKDVGAKKQRARLAKQLSQRNQPIEPKKTEKAFVPMQIEEPKKLKAKERRALEKKHHHEDSDEG